MVKTSGSSELLVQIFRTLALFYFCPPSSEWVTEITSLPVLRGPTVQTVTAQVRMGEAWAGLQWEKHRTLWEPTYPRASGRASKRRKPVS